MIATRREHPEMGPQKIKAYLGAKIDLSHQSIYEILRDAGLILPGPKMRRKFRSFARCHSNSLWQIDIKDLISGVYLISIMDDHSRLIVAYKITISPTAQVIIELLGRAIRMFGKPRQILTDHGSQFFSNKGGEATFDQFCRINGITHILAGVRKPTTIGKVERWHRTLEDELLKFCKDIEEFKERLPGYIEWYNTQRLHWALGLRTPLEVYLADFKSLEEFLSPADVHEVP